MAEFAPVAEADLPEIKEIYDYYIMNSTATFHSAPITTPGLLEILSINNPKYPSFTIRNEGTIIGYCFLARYKNRQAYDRTAELSVYLKPEYTGRGIGLSAINCLEEAAGKSGIRVLIGTICGENRAGIRLMEKAGFGKAAHLRNVGEKFGNVLDVVIYQKEI